MAVGCVVNRCIVRKSSVGRQVGQSIVIVASIVDVVGNVVGFVKSCVGCVVLDLDWHRLVESGY